VSASARSKIEAGGGHHRELSPLTGAETAQPVQSSGSLKEKNPLHASCAWVRVTAWGRTIAHPRREPVQALADFLRIRGQGTLFSLYDLFRRGKLRPGDRCFALGHPCHNISASIVLPSWPLRCSRSVEKMQRDEEGRKKSSRSGALPHRRPVPCSRRTGTGLLHRGKIPGRPWPVPDSSSALTTVLTLHPPGGRCSFMWLGRADHGAAASGNGARPPHLLLDRGADLARDRIRTIDALQGRQPHVP